MTVLALDLGTTTGWAVGVPGAWFSGTWNLKGGRYEGGGMRYLRFKGFLDEVVQSGIDSVVFEEVRRHAGTDAAHVYGGLMGVLTSWCEERSIPYEGVPVGTIKRFWTGKGNAGKPAMIAECSYRDIAVKDDNEADAVALLHYVFDQREKAASKAQFVRPAAE